MLGLLSAPLIYFWIRPGAFGKVDAAIAAAAMLIGFMISLVYEPPPAPDKVKRGMIAILVLGIVLLGFGLWDPRWVSNSAANALLSIGGAIVAAIGGVVAGSL